MVNDIMRLITDYDPEVGKAIEQEAARQRRNLELIASENIVSEPVMMAMGTVLTNKYAEGYSGKRYYGGCEYVDVVEKLGDSSVDMLEINVSCPNVKEGAIAFGQNADSLYEITSRIKKVAKQPVIMKLSPNVTDITEMARAAEAAGSDAISLINTITGMKIDIHRRKFALANKTGGMSGPAIKPVAVRMVYQCAEAVKIPIIGMGGIRDGEDAIEFLMAGATAVSVGAMNFANPYATTDVIDGIEAYMKQYGIEDIREIIGCMH